MNEAHKISRRLDAARDGKVHVEEATDKELAEMYRNKPVLLKGRVVSKKQEEN